MSERFITELFQVIDSKDWQKLSAFFSPDVVYERPGYEPIVGIERLLHFYQYERVLSAGRHFLENILVEGERGCCWGRYVGSKKDDTPVNEGFADVYIFHQGKIKSRRSFFFRPAI